MDLEIASSVDGPRNAADVEEMSEEKRQAVASLYQQCPALWTDFGIITDCVDVLGDPLASSETLGSKLLSVLQVVREHKHKARDGLEVELCRFAVVIGFVDLAVTHYHRLLRELGKLCLTRFEQPKPTAKEQCLEIIRELFLSCSLYSVEFSRRLIEAGFVNDLVEDLTHAQHMTGEAVERNSVILFSMGPLENFCLHAETEALVKEMGLVPVITPFLHKNSEVVRATSLAILSHLVANDQLDLLRMDPGVVTYFLRHVREAVAQKERKAGYWTVDEILSIILWLCRCEFNKKILVAIGAAETLLSVLDSKTDRDDDEKLYAVKIFLELSTNGENLCVFQNTRQLCSMMNNLMATGCPETRNLATDLVTRIQHDRREDPQEVLQGSAMAEMLSDQLNMLAILNVSPVHFVLDQLTAPQPQGAGPGDGKVRVLRALAELAERGGHYRREVMATGGLTLLKNILRDGNDEEGGRGHVLPVVLALIASEENLTIVKSQPELTDLLKAAAARYADSPDHRETASRLLSYLDQ